MADLNDRMVARPSARGLRSSTKVCAAICCASIITWPWVSASPALRRLPPSWRPSTTGSSRASASCCSPAVSAGSLCLHSGVVLFLSFRVQADERRGGAVTFWIYAGLVGVSFASLGLVYAHESIARVFFITAASFGGLSLWGYTTRRDLSGMGSFLFMGLIGLILAIACQSVSAEQCHAIRHLGGWRARVRGPHGLRHPCSPA